MDNSTYQNIPLLTDVIAVAPATGSAALNGVVTAPIAAPSSEQLEHLRQEVFENVMQAVLREVDQVLHQHLQDQLAVVLDNMADILKTRVRASMEQALVATVEQALAEEMAKIANAKKISEVPNYFHF
ncbi:hypothetical protein FHW67_000539 [Herbaspirillum sp. Sphag1AN]|uniref:hypothetical protein n=1 Tax=unclassified Herbaspirillum TaxID=2624150 RepID=UPI00160B97FE|nr:MULTISPECIES: hypothetical protein [unclassified Herbaspirillum]MBB3211304.1 hypothetical protein [Herbaspirillum sp. Sphag1AN]MBB3244933.1 hypothetical protein [Herbaspirillum sp. Sphag64]